jgi:sterol desaturase/sphingolipid hydroxylase (fatty acid hydroxylase superfamily)
MDRVVEQLTAWAQVLQAAPLVRSTGHAMLAYGAFSLAVFLAERRAGADAARYSSRNFFNDVVYTLFYRGGVYGALILGWCTGALEPRLSFMRLELLKQAPWPVGLAVFWIGADFALYWWHRLQHANRFLWALHSVHHSQQELNLLTAFRRHPLETLLGNVAIGFGIFHLVLGVPARDWMPLGVAIAGFIAIQHAQLDWGFGVFHRMVVSPRFHAFHHSLDPAHANANYGMILSVWDYIFGTAVPEQPRPTRYGIDGIDYRESLLRQLLIPFGLMWRWRRWRELPAGGTTLVPNDSAASPHAPRA